MFTVYGVEFKNASEFCRVLGYAKPISKSSLDQYGNTWDGVADVRLKMRGLSIDDKRARLQAEKDRYFKELPRKGRPVPLDRLVTFQAALRLACAHVTLQDLETAITATNSPLTADQLKAALTAFAADFSMEQAGRVLAKF